MSVWQRAAAVAGWMVLVAGLAVTAGRVQQMQTDIDNRVCSIHDTLTANSIEKAHSRTQINDLLGDFQAACPDYEDPGS